MTREVEVLVVGAGPAGATAALTLAPYRTVLLADAAREPVRRIGESLLPAAGRLLRDMGLFDSFQELDLRPWYANRSVWESESGAEVDLLQSPDGPGWHLDRPCFERFLRRAAQQRGAELLTPATAETIGRERDGFRVRLQTEAGPLDVTARFVIDAGGRSSPVGRKLGARRKTDLRLLCAGVYGRVRCSREGLAGLTFVEAVPDGWWYTAPLPGERRVVAFHTDADNAAAARVCKGDGLLTQLRQTAALAGVMNEMEFAPEERPFLCPASGSALDPCGGDDWLATGDAALTFDPLSSQGLLNALFLGLAAAEAAHSQLAGEASATAQYVSTVADIRAAYCRGLAETYAQVRRWPDSTFWRRRAGC